MVLAQLGQIAGLERDYDAALQHFRDAHAAAESLGRIDPGWRRRFTTANMRIGIGTSLQRLGRLEESLTEHDGAVQTFEELQGSDPENLEITSALLLGLLSRSRLHQERKDLDLAEEDLHQGRDITEELMAVDPANTQLLHFAVNLTFDLGDCLSARAEDTDDAEEIQACWQEARSWYQESLGLCEELLERGVRGQEETYPARCRERIQECEDRLATGLP